MCIKNLRFPGLISVWPLTFLYDMLQARKFPQVTDWSVFLSSTLNGSRTYGLCPLILSVPFSRLLPLGKAAKRGIYKCKWGCVLLGESCADFDIPLFIMTIKTVLTECIYISTAALPSDKISTHIRLYVLSITTTPVNAFSSHLLDCRSIQSSKGRDHSQTLSFSPPALPHPN